MTDYVAPHEQIQNGRAARFVKQYWFIIVFIFTVGVIYSEIRAESKANAFIIEKHEQAIQNNATAINAIDRQYIEDITYIKTRLEELFGDKKRTQSLLDSLKSYTTP